MSTNKTEWFEMSMKFDSSCIQCGNRMDAGTRHMARKNGEKPNGNVRWEFKCMACEKGSNAPGGTPPPDSSNPLDILEKAREHMAGEKAEVTQNISTEEENHLFGMPDKFSQRWFDQNAVWGRI